MVSVTILTFAVGTLMGLHHAVLGGIGQSDRMSVALDIAKQRAEDLSGAGPDALPNCLGPQPAGCRAGSKTLSAPMPPSGAFECTKFVRTADVPSPNGVAVKGEPSIGANGDRVFRVDTSLGPHPDPSQPDARLLTVSVCWRLQSGMIKQVQAQKLVVPGV